MRIYLGFDHNGFTVYPSIVSFLKQKGHEVIVFGNDPIAPEDDYPQIVERCAQALQHDSHALGILMCGSGGGVCVAANKFPGIYAVLASTPFQAQSARHDDHANVLCVGTKVNTVDEITTMIDIFLSETPGEGRHARRFAQVQNIEKGKSATDNATAIPRPFPHLAASLLSADLGHLQNTLDAMTPFVDRWHYDVMDGHFVPNLTFGLPLLKKMSTTLPIDAHFMVENPEQYIAEYAPYCDTMYIHAESTREKTPEVLELIRKQGKRAGLSWRPSTPLASVEQYLPFVDTVLIMTVEPGKSGQPLIPEALPTINYIHEKYPHIIIAVDGGVNTSNAQDILERGASILISGSTLFDAINREVVAKQLRGKNI